MVPLSQTCQKTKKPSLCWLCILTVRRKNEIKKEIAIALCAVALTSVGVTAVVNDSTQVANASASHAGYNNWIQYGTLKYALKGPSGKVYPAGTKVARYSGDITTPAKSQPGKPFLLTLMLAGNGDLNLQFGGGRIAETYVNAGEWQQVGDPDRDKGMDIVQSSSDMTDLDSSDFHPVDSSNQDVVNADLTELKQAYHDWVFGTAGDPHNANDVKVSDKLMAEYHRACGVGVTQSFVDQVTAKLRASLEHFKKTGNIDVNDNSASKPSSDKNTAPKPKKIRKKRKIKLRKASYRYNHKGKRVSKRKLKKGTTIKIKNALYSIKNKLYYRIGKNRYIRAVNAR